MNKCKKRKHCFPGLLAGLDEFPTSPNVPASMSRARQLKIPQEILTDFLHRDVQLFDAAQKHTPNGPKSGLRIAKVQPAGDVVHVFSHIKKTYRVQWVLLEGTSDVPELAAAGAFGDSSNTAKTEGKAKSRKADKISDVMPCSTWVPLDEVATKK